MIVPKADFKKAYQLLHEGAKALSDVTATGICIDIPYLQKQQKKMNRALERTIIDIFDTDEGKLWKRHYGSSVNFNSVQQVSDIFFKKAGHARPVFNEDASDEYSEDGSGDDAMDQKVLKDLEFNGVACAGLLLQYRKYHKVLHTYIRQLLVETIDGIVHPGFPLNKVQTYRGSSEGPNFQNMPIRDPEIGKIVRSSILPRKGNLLLEADFKALEVGIQVCYHRDPRMIEEQFDVSKDMHRDTAIDLFLLQDFVYKNIIDGDPLRKMAKNKVVFPMTYGSFWKNIAPPVWRDLIVHDYKIMQDLPLFKHLANNGIPNEKKFTEHLKKVEYSFWNERYPVYKKWREDWYSLYLQRGFFDGFTGFRYTGLMKRTDVINYAVQGSGFHCLLQSLILFNKWLKKRKFKTRIIAQIHDSLILDVCPSELDMVIKKLTQIMTKQLPEMWPWIIIPLRVSMEGCPINGSWHEKEKI